jgi:hypothetical protein
MGETSFTFSPTAFLFVLFRRVLCRTQRRNSFGVFFLLFFPDLSGSTIFAQKQFRHCPRDKMPDPVPAKKSRPP